MKGKIIIITNVHTELHNQLKYSRMNEITDMCFKDLVSRMVPDLSNLDQEFLDKYDLNSKGKLLVDEPKDKEKSSDKTTLDNNIDKNTETIQPKKKISIKKNTEKLHSALSNASKTARFLKNPVPEPRKNARNRRFP